MESAELKAFLLGSSVRYSGSLYAPLVNLAARPSRGRKPMRHTKFDNLVVLDGLGAGETYS